MDGFWQPVFTVTPSVVKTKYVQTLEPKFPQ